MNGKELKRLLGKNGWVLDHVTGSHHIFKKGSQRVSLPIHGKKEIGKGLLHSINKKAGLK